MEAEAIYSYQSTDPAVFSLNVGDELIIIPIDENWCRAKMNGQEAFAPLAYLKVEPHPWFKGGMSREQSSNILCEKAANGDDIHPDGVFVIRDSTRQPGYFSLTVKHKGRMQHFRIYYFHGKFKLWDEEFDSFNKLIKYHNQNSINPSEEILLKEIQPIRYYRAKDNFEAQDAESELSFRTGDVLKILDSNDENWWKAEFNQQIGLVPSALLELNHQS